MSTFVNLPSVCGATSASVDVYDVDLNPHGVICCDNCKSIGLFIQGGKVMTLFNFDLMVTIEAEDFESALSWLKAMPLERHDFEVIDYNELEIA
jgi:hypothetical protein